MRSIDPAEQIAARVGAPGLSTALAPLLPAGVFLLSDRWLGLVVAMVAASLTTVLLILVRRRRGRGVGVILPLSLAYVVVKAVAGVLSESQVVYFGAGLALSALIAVAVGATAFTARPVASYLIPYVSPYPPLPANHPVYHRVSAQVTLVWAVAELALTGWEAWHLTVATASEFVLTRTVIAWPVMAVLIFFLIAYVRFRLDRYGWEQARSAGA